MTLDDIKKLITFSQSRPDDFGRIKCRAHISILAELRIDENPTRQPPDSEIKKQLTREILRRLYDDRQREFAELLMEHAMVLPLSEQFHESRRKLISIARHMEPKDE